MDEAIRTAPYLHCCDHTGLRMLDVSIALLPAVAGALWFFGWQAALVLLAALAGCLAAEWGCGRLLHRGDLRDGSAAVTGLLLGLLLPPGCPWWAALAGGAAAAAVKGLSGGLGRNPVNPAALARVLLLALPALRPAPMRMAEGNFLMAYLGGSLGETSTLLLLAGAVYLMIRRLIPLRITGPALAAVFLTGLCIPGCDPLAVAAWGGSLLASAFLAADPVTSPMNGILQILYGLGAGVLCTLAAYYGFGIAGTCCGILAVNLLGRLAELLLRRWNR